MVAMIMEVEGEECWRTKVCCPAFRPAPAAALLLPVVSLSEHNPLNHNCRWQEYKAGKDEPA